MAEEIKVHRSFFDFREEEWNALVPDDSVFQEWGFLSTLERTGCIQKGRDWEIFIFAYWQDSQLVAAFPLYQRSDSYGEFIFDFQWANAFHRAGIPYYPKFTSCVPFTPVTGQRVLFSGSLNQEKKEKIIKSLLEYAKEFGKDSQISSVHILFCKEEELSLGVSVGFHPRLSHQYHWINQGYNDFEHFLSSLVKERRKTIRQERKKIKESGILIETLVGEQIEAGHADLFYSFYMDTHSKKWGQAYLNREFFREIFKTMKHRIHLVLAKSPQGEPLGGSFNFLRGEYLFGRYWGALSYVPNLHFECCYYQLIDYAIQNQLKRVEAGAQGEHKFLRGYEAVPMHSLHYIYHESGSEAIYRYLEKEIEMERANIEGYNAHSPLKALRQV